MSASNTKTTTDFKKFKNKTEYKDKIEAAIV